MACSIERDVTEDRDRSPALGRFLSPPHIGDWLSLARFCATTLAQQRRDVLVEFEPGHVPGFALVNLEDELSLLMGCKVDLHTPGSLSKYFRDRVVREAQDQYVEREDRVRLQHMLDASRQAIAFVQGRRRDELDRDLQLTLALTRLVEIVARQQRTFPMKSESVTRSALARHRRNAR